MANGKVSAELWPELKANKAALLRAIDARDAEYERVFDLAIDWKEYWSGN